MTTAEVIATLLHEQHKYKKYDTKKLVETLTELVYAELNEEGLEGDDVKQQILSEMLYLLEKAERHEVNAAFVSKRLRFLQQNVQTYKILMLSFNDAVKVNDVVIETKKTETKKRKRGWNKKTRERYAKYVLKQKRLTLFAAA